MGRGLTDDERSLLTHVTRFGSDGYPIRKLSRGWVWSYRGIAGSPSVFKTRRAAVASFEAFYLVLIDAKAGRI